MATGLAKARWIGPYEAETPQHGLLIPGETVVEIPKGEAEASDYWELVGGKVADKSDSKGGS